MISERQPLLAPPASNAKAQPQPPTVNQLSKVKLCWILAATLTAVFLGGMDGTIVATLQQPISNYFGRLSDILGRKGAMLVALFFLTLGTIGCGFSRSMDTFIASRFIAGMGGGGIMTVTSIVLTDLVSLRNRGLMQGATNVLFGAGAGLGGPVGGYISDHFDWRTAFLFQIPLLIASFTLILIHVNVVLPKPRVPLTLKQQLRRIDWLGPFTLLIFVGSLLLGLSLKTTEELEWSDVRVRGLLLTSIIFLICFIGAEAKISPEPIMPLNMLLSLTPLAVALNNFFCSFIFFSMLYNVPLYFMAVRLQTASEAGLHILPNSIAQSLGGVGAGLILRYTGKYWGSAVIGAGLLLLANMLIACWDRNSTSEFEFWFDIVPNVTYLFRTTGRVVGVSLSGTLFQAVLLKKLRETMPGPDTAKIIEAIRHDASLVRFLDGTQKEAAVQSFAQALRAVFICQAIAAFMALLCSLPIEERPLPETREEHQESDERHQDSGRNSSV
ncbi:MFS general substrate transporter [Serendipita vermifera]|nr:MFS general substrate transporter [Serendipita vermifera]